MENWKTISEAPEYSVSDLGNVRRISRPQRNREYPPVKGILYKSGYRRAYLYTSAGIVRKTFHRLVLEAFVGPSALPINHKNGNKDDNRLENLEYVTAAENRAHAKVVLDAYPKGSGHPNSKLKESDVRKIREMIAAGLSDAQIAPVFNCTAANINIIRKKRGWAHVV